jgi:2-oxo-4-hydroxy-4-carboxy-5-ureidoimidazoline decarboxylase
VAPVPIRLRQTEGLLNGKALDPSLTLLAAKTAAAEVQPIDDIRSTARYRGAVVSNLVVEFLGKLGTLEKSASNGLELWNGLPRGEAEKEILPCCGSRMWARGMAERRPFANEASLLAFSDETWRKLGEADWMEAFQSHPRIGESHAEQSGDARAMQWSAHEQSDAKAAGEDVRNALAECNREYERRFGRIFIVCASGKGGAEILEILRKRLHNDPEAELQESAEQQRQITQIRLKKWLRE